ncbi:YaaR family protein [Spirochaeta africana]|uniref:DUF327 domain-containing protein n=1 Tax=Spirochaeta africana (strain ATCC 700263 / DSM 8902 / Z-7692) TaxID=889378 RepID=H9UKF7_SPIAZ|nr:DUF327 family protein [Spirochaeta africana]AFG38000.1 hypothetical protein Spiaf_1949 [Spirochaeta africana DSM 8902]
MERIDIQPGSFFPLSQQPARSDKKKRSKRPAGVFGKLLEDGQSAETAAAAGPLQQQEAEELFQEIQAAGERLKQFPGQENSSVYRELVRALVEKVVRDGIIVEEHSSGSHILKRKSFSLLRVVDAKLAQLLDGVAATQREQLQLMAQVEEIQGLLIDMLH